MTNGLFSWRATHANDADIRSVMAIVARDETLGAALKQAGAPTVLYPIRNAVDYAVEHLKELIRPKEESP